VTPFCGARGSCAHRAGLAAAVGVGGDLHESDGGRLAMAKARPKERKTKGRGSPASPLMGKKMVVELAG
jgi:hypothetical protein